MSAKDRRSRLRPSLTREELRAIAKRNPGNKDVVALLWDIRRYWILALRAESLQRTLGPSSGMHFAEDIHLDALREILDELAPVHENRQRLKELGFGDNGDDD